MGKDSKIGKASKVGVTIAANAKRKGVVRDTAAMQFLCPWLYAEFEDDGSMWI